MFRASNSPLCPKCDSVESRVLGRYTSQLNECIRERVCQECGYRWKTVQSAEEELDPSIRVIFPKWTTPDGMKRRVKVEYVSKIN